LVDLVSGSGYLIGDFHGDEDTLFVDFLDEGKNVRMLRKGLAGILDFYQIDFIKDYNRKEQERADQQFVQETVNDIEFLVFHAHHPDY
jgi:hypothetical protein